TEDDRTIFKTLENMNYIVLVNKVDLDNKLDIEEVNELTQGHAVITTSIVNDEGIDQLEKALSDLFFTTKDVDNDTAYVSNVRHIQRFKQSKPALEEGREALEMAVPIDMVQIDVRRRWELLGEIVGDTASDSLIDQLFSQFCLGK